MTQHLNLRQAPLVELWHWLGAQIRWGLKPDDPTLIHRYLDAGRQACQTEGIEPWRAGERSFLTLLAAATDRELPWHWRITCLDNAHRPLAALAALAGQFGKHAARQPALQKLARQLAMADMAPGRPPRAPARRQS